MHGWRSLLFAVCLVGCAADPFGAYKKTHPDWFPVMPATDVPLDETLTGTVQELSVDDLVTGKIRLSDEQDYAIAVLVWCHSEVALERYTGERASWYLLPKNRVSAFDHYDFTERCTVGNDYRPATGSLVSTEKQLSQIANEMTHEPVHAAQLYRKGVVLVKVRRFDDARAMLTAGDQSSAHGEGSEGPRFDAGRKVTIGRLSEDEAARQELVQALKNIDVEPGTPPAGANSH